jgi:AcrR family transcriptional regulator
MQAMLRCRSFHKITVYDICEKALVSRGAFYAHFSDKYDLLESLLREMRETINNKVKDCCEDELVDFVSEMFQKNSRMFSNLLSEPDDGIIKLILAFLSPNGYAETEAEAKELNVNHVVLVKFITGGLLNLIFYRIQCGYFNGTGLNMPTAYIHRLLKAILAWEKSHPV